MPQWAGKWKGGRFYLDADGRKVFFIERRKRVLKLATHDELLAVGQLARFLEDPIGFERERLAPQPTLEDLRGPEPVYITRERLTLYLESIADAVIDHRKARRSYLHAWAELGIDLRTVDRKALRAALGTFEGGHRGRTEALNAFARWLVREGELEHWTPLVNHRAPQATRAERQAYTLEQLGEVRARLSGPLRDLFDVRAATGMHHTEIAQLAGARLTSGPLPDRGAWIRELPAGHTIAGVLQVVHKSRRRHRQSVDAATLAAALRLREGVPGRLEAWKAFEPLAPSNLRHTFVTLAGEVGELVTYRAAGVDRGRIAQTVGHRAGSTMTADRYDKLQVPPLIKLPLLWAPAPASKKARAS